MMENPEFWKDYDKSFETFKLGVLLKQAPMDAGMTQEQSACGLLLFGQEVGGVKLEQILFDQGTAFVDEGLYQIFVGITKRSTESFFTT